MHWYVFGFYVIHMLFFNTWTDIVASAPAVTGSVFLRGYSYYFRDSVDVYILYLLQGAHFLILKISKFVDLPIMKKCSLVKN